VRQYQFGCNYSFAGQSDTGILRKKNEDKVFMSLEMPFFGVSDGMGGMRFGQESAEMVSLLVPEAVENLFHECGDKISSEKAAELLKQAIIKVSDYIYETDKKSGSFEHGATLSCVLLLGDSAVFCNLGDSRGYIIRGSGGNGKILQVTEDHNLAGEYVRLGKMTKEEAMDSLLSTQLTRFMGMDPPAEPDTFIVKLKEWDRILLCSDGLHGMIDDEEICDIALRNLDPEERVQELIDAANKAGGRDNVSAGLIIIIKNNWPERPEPEGSLMKIEPRPSSNKARRSNEEILL